MVKIKGVFKNVSNFIWTRAAHQVLVHSISKTTTSFPILRWTAGSAFKQSLYTKWGNSLWHNTGQPSKIGNSKNLDQTARYFDFWEVDSDWSQMYRSLKSNFFEYTLYPPILPLSGQKRVPGPAGWLWKFPNQTLLIMRTGTSSMSAVPFNILFIP